jgi:hypothetical protein
MPPQSRLFHSPFADLLAPEAEVVRQNAPWDRIALLIALLGATILLVLIAPPMGRAGGPSLEDRLLSEHRIDAVEDQALRDVQRTQRAIETRKTGSVSGGTYLLQREEQRALDRVQQQRIYEIYFLDEEDD